MTVLFEKMYYYCRYYSFPLEALEELNWEMAYALLGFFGYFWFLEYLGFSGLSCVSLIAELLFFVVLGLASG